MSVDKWLDRKYKQDVYTCSDFVREVWLDLTQTDLAPALQGLLERHSGRGLTRAHVRMFRVLAEPVDPCIVVMQHPKMPVHLALFIRGRILQLTQLGVEFQPPKVATRFHTSYRYIKCTI